MNAIGFIFVAAFAAGAYSIFARLAAPAIHQAFGALLIALIAAALSFAVLLATRGDRPLYAEPSVFLYIGLIGAAAFAVDYFSLQAYSRGLSLSVGQPIFIGVAIASASLAGLAMGESVTLTKLAGIILVIAGAIVLTVFA